MAKALLRTQASAKASHWEGAPPAHSPFMHAHAQAVTPPENVMAGDRPGSHSDDDMHTGALYQNQQHLSSQQVGTSMHPDDCVHEHVLPQPYLYHTCPSKPNMHILRVSPASVFLRSYLNLQIVSVKDMEECQKY